MLAPDFYNFMYKVLVPLLILLSHRLYINLPLLLLVLVNLIVVTLVIVIGLLLQLALVVNLLQELILQRLIIQVNPP
jgi:hypothetical protein